MKPTEHIFAWVEGLPPTLQPDLIFLVSMMFPGFEDPVHEPEKFRSQLSELVPRETQVAGAALALVTIVDHILATRTSTDDQVKDAQALSERMAADIESNPTAPAGLGERLRARSERLPLLGKQWAREIAAWEKLKEGPLATDQVSKWLDSALALKLR